MKFDLEKSKRYRSKVFRIFTASLVIISVAAEAGALAAGVYGGNRIINNFYKLEAINEAELEQSPNSEIYADDGTTLLWTNSKYQHRHLSIKDTPEILIDLLLSTEDKDFWSNKGFSVTGTLNALSGDRGGSTITQQLIKNMRFSDTDISKEDRKIKEIALAINLTSRFDKSKILEAYLNKTGFLESSYGFNTAMYLLYGDSISKDKTSVEDIAKYAMIVGMLQNPSIYNPRTNPDSSKTRRDQVLFNAYNNNKLTLEQYKEAKEIPIDKDLKEQGWLTQQTYDESSSHGSYVDSILRQLKSLGYDYESRANPVKVVSALNIERNKWLQDKVSDPYYYQDDKQQTAIAVTDPKTGIVLAQVGSRYGGAATDLNRAVQQTRSSGSTIKPFLDYAPLIEFAGVTANTTWQANETTYAGTNFVVRNYAGAKYGTVTTQYALKMSLNVPAVLALESQQPWMNQTIMSKIGLANHTLDEDGNVVSVQSFGGSDALGINVSVVDFAAAFSALASYGVYKSPNYLKTVEQAGNVTEIKSEETPAMSPATAYSLLSMLKTVGDPDGTGRFSAIPEYKGYALKTGTVAYDDNAPIYSDESHSEYIGTAGRVIPDLSASDTWVAGTTKSVSVALWDGYDDPSVYGHWIREHFLRRTDLFKEVVRYFNSGQDTSDWTATSEKIDLTADQTDKSDRTIDSSTLSSMKNVVADSSSVQKVVKNDKIATKEQKQFYDDFMKKTLKDPYQPLIDFYNSNNKLKPALKANDYPTSSRIYHIEESGRIKEEQR